MNIKEIKEMISLMNDNNLAELEIEKEGMRIKLKKAGTAAESLGPTLIVEKHKGAESAAAAPAATRTDTLAVKTVEIRAPMVGTFYRAPSPESPSYVEAGQTVEIGQVICIIEAMKLMNEIKAEVRGKLLELLVDNAEPVEFGQPMFLIEPL